MRRGVSPIVAACILLVVGLIIAIVLGARIMQHASVVAPRSEKRLLVSCVPLNESLWLCVVKNELGKWFYGNLSIAAKDGVHTYSLVLKPDGYARIFLRSMPLTCSAEHEKCVFRYGKIVVPTRIPVTTITVPSTTTSTPSTSTSTTSTPLTTTTRTPTMTSPTPPPPGEPGITESR